MEKQTREVNDLKRERQKKFFLFLPLVIVPFLTLLLWSVGVVGGNESKAASLLQQSGFNFHLPAATQAKDSNWNKMQYYAAADKDSERLRSLMRASGMVVDSGNRVAGITVSTDPKEQLIEQKIAALNKKLSEPVKSNAVYDPGNSSYENEIPEPSPAQRRAALQRIKEQQEWANKSSSADTDSDTEQADPELEKLNGMLDKVIAIQHPEQKKEQVPTSDTKEVYSVEKKRELASVSLLGNPPEQDTVIKTRPNRFYGLNDGDVDTSIANTIAAEIPEDQVLVSGATVKLRLLNAVTIRGVAIPKDQLLYGVANIKGERLEVTISSIGYNGRVLPVALSVYDIDGQEGLYVPGAITRDVAKQSADQAVETMNFGTYDASLGAQAASAGIQAAKTLIGKKVKQVKVAVKSGYKVWLRDMNEKEAGR